MSLTTTANITTAVASHPQVRNRLLAGIVEREDLEQYRAAGGYGAVDDVERLLEIVDEAGLRGRGGAAFPTSRKIQTVREGADVPVVVANGEEGEPASVKDKWLLRHRPHLVLDGLRLAALMVGSEDVHVYVADVASASSIQLAIDELGRTDVWNTPITLTVVSPTYVAGEETAVVQALNGGPPLPTDKPPRPFEVGVAGRPTLINNVETLANLPLIHRLGAVGYRELGTAASPGTFLLTLTRSDSGGLYEVPFGETIRGVLGWLGEDADAVSGLLMGGYFSGVLGAHGLDVPLDYDSMKAIESGLGCGAIALISTASCPVAVSAAVMNYFAQENAAQCGSCFNGTAAMSAVLQALVDYRVDDADLKRLEHWSTFLRGRGACGTLDGATNVAASLLREFPELVADHQRGSCAVCDSGPRPSDPPFAVALPAATYQGESSG
jgi:NADH:ubiquinone oxidoreductase subunit F (NADH-binding)